MPLTHFDAEGKARMVDVTEKKETVREATATGKIKVSRDVYDAIEAGTVGKGDVLSVATTAGIMGVKRTADLIPMCHILPITNCKIRFEKDPKNLEYILPTLSHGLEILKGVTGECGISLKET